jgi:hypothetical protein
MKQTRAQLLWIFQAYLDKCSIFQPERRECLSALFVDGQLSTSTEKDFKHWLKTSRRLPRPPVVMRSRGSRLAVFSTWLDRTRPDISRDDRERLIRLYNSRQLSGKLVVEFHQFARANDNDYRKMP